MNVLITDTSSRFGHAIALEFLKTGAVVYGISENENDRLTQYTDYHQLICDSGRLDELKLRLKDFLNDLSTIELVILNTGIVPLKDDIKNPLLEKVITLMNINVLANKLIIDTLLEQIPSIYQVVAIFSGSANCGESGKKESISNAALNTLMQLYARELPEIHFSAIEPGVTNGDPDEIYSRLMREGDRNINGLYGINRHGLITNPEYAANCLVEAMGIMLQEESGSSKAVKDILLAPEMG